MNNQEAIARGTAQGDGLSLFLSKTCYPELYLRPMAKRFSFIIPVFNRPDEVEELLDSLAHQTITDFEVIVVEDGSEKTCRDVCLRFQRDLDLHYYMKDNSGPGPSRNYGAERAHGEFLIILDSDVVLPPNYLKAVAGELANEPCDAFGGPDRASSSFTPVQKAISYSMTSFFTTGGIRGGKKKLDKFYPRSFNMGVRRTVYQELNGFSKMRFGEDIDFSLRIVRSGHKTRLFPGAWVYHKRRTDFRKFWRQVYNSGIARINLYKRYPDSLKLVHLLPAVFTLGVACLLLLALAGIVALCLGASDFGRAALWTGLTPIILYALLIFCGSLSEYRNLRVALLSIAAAFIQLSGYGCGFLGAVWKRLVKGQSEYQAYEKNFYK